MLERQGDGSSRLRDPSGRDRDVADTNSYSRETFGPL